MAQFADITITRTGLDMIAKSQTGDHLIFTGIKIGDGQIGAQSIPDMTDLINFKQDVPINSVTAKENGHAEIIGIIDNENLDVGFFVREIGIYAKINDGGTPALYGYANAGNFASYISDKSVPMDAIKFKIDIVIGNSENVSFTSDKSIVYVTQENLDAHNEAEDAHPDIRQKITDDISAHNKDENAHSNLIRVKSMTTTDDGINYTTQDGQSHGLNLWDSLKRAITGATTGSSDKNSLFQQLDAVAGMIKKITGGANWYDNPAYSIQQLASMVNSVSAISEYDVDDPNAWWVKLRGAPGIIIQGGNSGQPNNYNIIVNYAIRYSNKPFFNIAIPIISDSDRTTYSISYTGDGGNSKAHFLSNMASSPSVQYISFGY